LPRRVSRGPLLWLLLVGLAAGACAVKLQGAWLDSNLLSMLPQDPLPANARALAEQHQDRFTDRTLWLVPAENAAGAAAHGRALRAMLKQSDLFSEVGPNLDPTRLQQRYQALRPYRFQLLAPRDRQRLENDPQALIDNALARVFGPFGLSGDQWRDDPLFLFEHYLQALAPFTLELEDGIPLATADGRYWALTTATVRAGGFALDRQSPLLSVSNDVQQRWPDSLVTGAPLYTAAGADSARREMSTVGLFSLAAVATLFLVLFGGPRPMLLALASVATGLLCGLAATLWVFGQIHLLGLVFGAGLIGVAVDYGIHFFCQRLDQPGVAPRTLRRHLAAPLALALISSVLGYLAMGLAAFPGLRQVAVFSAVGLSGAWLTVMLAVPALSGRAPPPRQRLLARVGRWRRQWPAWCRHHRPVLLLAAAALLATGLWRLTPDDDVRHYQSPPAWLQAQGERIQALLPRGDSRYFIVHGETPAQWWQRERDLAGELDALISEHGALDSYRAISALWQPEGQQQALRQTLGERLYHHPRFADYLQQLGLGEAALARQQQALEDAAGNSLSLDGWLAAVNDDSLRGQWGGCDRNGCTSLVQLAGLQDRDTVAGLAAADRGRYFIDRAGAVSGMLATLREHLAWLLLGAYLLSGLVLALARGPARALRLLGVPTLASVVALAALGWLQGGFGLITVLALYLLLGIGIDYAIFFSQPEKRRDAVALAVLLSAATTSLSFGLLSLSATRLVADFGLTLLLGIAAAALIAPLLAAAPQPDTQPGARP